MPSNKRAQLLPDLLEGRAAKRPSRERSSALSLVKNAPRDDAADVPPPTAIGEAPADPHAPVASKKASRRAGDLSAVPIAGPAARLKAAAPAGENAFHKKGGATAASFRPWYWQY